MRKIGIYTFWNVPNYGTFMQAYALRNTIQEIASDAIVQQINYLDSVHYAKYYKVIPKEYRWPLLNGAFYRNTLQNLLSRSKIDSRKKFLDYYDAIENTGKLTKEELEQFDFDCVVLGSDIIWDWSIPFFNHDVHLFGNNFNCRKTISYACSFGTVKSGMEIPKYVRDGLRLQESVSVRDNNSALLVKEIAGKDALVVADPTFLWDLSKDRHIPKRKINEKYIVVYGSDFEPHLMRGAVTYAKEHGLKIVCLDSLDDSFGWCDVNIHQDDMTPFDWCSYFKYADIIFTCTYHGLMFGIIFNKAIVFSPTQFILSKVSSLMEYIGVKEPFVELKSFAEKADWNWVQNYAGIINPRLEALKNKSIQYLKQALMG